MPAAAEQVALHDEPARESQPRDARRPEVVVLTPASEGAGLHEALSSLVSAPPQPFPPPEPDEVLAPEPPVDEVEPPAAVAAAPEAEAEADVEDEAAAEAWPPVTAAEPDPAEPAGEPASVHADVHEEGHLEHLSERFFGSPHDLEPLVSWEEVEAPEMTEGARRAMLATAGILGISLVAIAAFVAYHRLVMPVPVELADAAQLPPAIPQPLVPPPAPSGSVLSTIAAPSAAPEVPTAQPTAPADEGAGATTAEPVMEEPSVASGDAPATVGAGEPGAPEPATDGPAAADSPVIVGEAEVVARGTIPDDSGFAAMLGTANTLYRRGRSEEALEAYHRALSYRPDAPQALSRIAYIHLNTGDNVRARQFAARAVEIDPSSSEGWIVLGASLAALGDRPGALTAYKKCATLGTGSYVIECRRLSR